MGSGRNFQSISSNIVSAKLINGQGELIEITRESEITIDGITYRLYDALGVSLGLLGVLVEVTLQCVPQFHLKSTEHVISFDEYAQNAIALSKKHEYFKAWWFPHTDKVFVFEIDKTTEVAHTSLTSKQEETLCNLDADTHPLFEKTIEDPTSIPKVNQNCLNQYFFERTQVGKAVDVLVSSETVPMVVTEFAIPEEDGIQALKEFRRLLLASDNYLHFPVDLRFSASEDFWLSPAYKRNSFYIGMCVRLYKEQETPKVFQLFYDVMQQYKARPHWGKLFDSDVFKAKEHYEKLEAFLTVKKHFDPNNRFTNKYLQSWLET